MSRAPAPASASTPPPPPVAATSKIRRLTSSASALFVTPAANGSPAVMPPPPTIPPAYSPVSPWTPPPPPPLPQQLLLLVWRWRLLIHTQTTPLLLREAIALPWSRGGRGALGGTNCGQSRASSPSPQDICSTGPSPSPPGQGTPSTLGAPPLQDPLRPSRKVSDSTAATPCLPLGMVWTLLRYHSPVILLDMHMSTIASLASRTGSTGSAAAAAFTILRLPAL